MKTNNKKQKQDKNNNSNSLNIQTGFGYLKAKKHLGQNFLKSKEAIRAICNAGKVQDGDIVIEIGPGKGVLTEELIKRGANVIAIEKDSDLIDFLKEKFKNNLKISKPGLDILEEDCLVFDPDIYLKNIYLKNNINRGLKNQKNESKYKIIANIPYNITGSIIKKFLSEVKNKPTLMALLVQKEVAERIVAKNPKNILKVSKPGLDRGKESVLSLSVKAYGDPKYIMKVSKKYFSPSPKVDSAIILIDNISNKNFKTPEEEKLFFKIVKAGFSHKRKVLIKNLEESGVKKDILEKMFNFLEINQKIRAEDVAFPKWLEIKNFIYKNTSNL